MASCFRRFLHASRGGVGIVVYNPDDIVISLLFKLEFPCSNSEAKYEALLMGLIYALQMGIQRLCVLGDSRLISRLAENFKGNHLSGL